MPPSMQCNKVVRWGRREILLVPVWNTLNVPTLLIAIFAMLALFRSKLGMMKTIGCCAALGVIYTAVRWVFV